MTDISKLMSKQNLWPSDIINWKNGMNTKPLKQGNYITILNDCNKGYEIAYCYFDGLNWEIEESNNYDAYNINFINVVYYISLPNLEKSN